MSSAIRPRYRSSAGRRLFVPREYLRERMVPGFRGGGMLELISALAEIMACEATGADVLVVDDGSPTSAARPIVRDAGARYLRVRHGGYIRARMAGLLEVETPYVAFLDDDDALLDDWLSAHRSAMDAGADVVAGSFFETDAMLAVEREVTLAPATFDDLMAGDCAVNDGALIRRSLLERVTWHPERQTAAMFSLWLDLAADGAVFAAVQSPTWLHRLHGASMSTALDARDDRWRAKAIASHR